MKEVVDFLKHHNLPYNNERYQKIAIKFLMARKFDVERAIKLYNDHEILRKKENLDFINLDDEEFIENLESGKFTILPFVKNSPACALFTVKLHKVTTDASDLITLKNLIYQLDGALENPDAQKNGFDFIYDMNNCKRSNYDLNLSQKILTIIKGSYPARLNKLYVVCAPFWFKCVVKVLSILMREKIRERVTFVNNEELRNYIAVEMLPDYLGGSVKLNHKDWLTECQKLVLDKASTCNSYYFSKCQNGNSNENEATSNNPEAEKTTNRKRQINDLNDFEDNKLNKKQISSTTEFESDDFLIKKIDPLPFTNYYESIQNFENGFSVDELAEHVKKTMLSTEFNFIRVQPIVSPYDVFKQNNYKNRYRDVVCLDETRVKLVVDKQKSNNEVELNEINSDDDDEDEDDSFERNDYIHANYVDGYKQNRAYICTQGPLEETVGDFWLMIWQQSVLTIAMTTKVIEQRKLKCAQYWPLEKDDVLEIDDFVIKNKDIEDLGDFKMTKLAITHLPTNTSRDIVHCQFLSWPDHGVPKTASQIIDFIEIVRKHQKELLKQLTDWNGHPLGPPICIHCSAGIGRTGTFLTIDININRLNDLKTVHIENTVNKIRLQRAQSVQMPDQYSFCYLAILEYAQGNNLLKNTNLNINELFNGFS